MVAGALPRPVSLRERILTVGLGLGGRGVLGLGLGRSAVSAAAGNGLLNSLVACWPSNEDGGANDMLDVHTNALHLTQVSSPGADTGQVYATARTFDGSADYFNRVSEALLETGDVDFTFAAWVYRTADGMVIGKDNAGSSREHHLFVGSALTQFNAFRAGPVIMGVNGAGVGSSAWALVLAWHDSVANTVNVQVNGGAVASAATTGPAISAAATFTIGRRQYSASPAYFGGRIGPVAFWKSAAGEGGVLSSEQRTALYNGGAGLAYANFTT